MTPVVQGADRREPPYVALWRDGHDRRGELRRRISAWLQGPEALVVLTCAAWSLALEIVALGSVAYLDPAVRLPGQSVIVSAWQRWDANWYEKIVTVGYHAHVSRVHHYFMQTAFFPGFPLVARLLYELVHPLGMGAIVAMLITNQLLVLALAILLYRLAHALTGDREAGSRSVKYLLLFPWAYFLLAPYTEALFLTSLAGFSWALVSRRYLLAGTFAAVASGTRLVGVVLPLVLIVGYLEQHSWRLRSLRPKVLLAAVIGFAGAVAFAVYQWVVFGNPLYTQSASRLWGRSFNLAVWKPISGMFLHFGKPTAGYLLNTPLEVWEILPLLAAFIVLTIAVWRRFGTAMGLMCALLMLIPLTSNSMLSYNRYLLPLLPCFVLLGVWGRHKVFDVLYSAVGGGLLVLFLIGYTHGVWTG
jgi:hypothetical protein